MIHADYVPSGHLTVDEVQFMWLHNTAKFEDSSIYRHNANGRVILRLLLCELTGVPAVCSQFRNTHLGVLLCVQYTTAIQFNDGADLHVKEGATRKRR